MIMMSQVDHPFGWLTYVNMPSVQKSSTAATHQYIMLPNKCIYANLIQMKFQKSIQLRVKQHQESVQGETKFQM